MGFIITIAEPDLQLLAKQVYAIPSNIMILAVSGGVGVLLVLFLVKVYFKIKLGHMLAALYGIVFILAIFVPKEFLSIAFDSGGVASGPMTVAFVLPLAMGASSALGGNVYMDAFGIVAMVAMAPLITLQIFGLIYKIKLYVKKDESSKKEKFVATPIANATEDKPIEWDEE